MTTANAEEQPMDRMDALALEMRAGFAEMRASAAELRAGQAESRTALAEFRTELAESRTELAEFRTWTSGRFATLIDAVADLRSDLRDHTHDD